MVIECQPGDYYGLTLECSIRACILKACYLTRVPLKDGGRLGGDPGKRSYITEEFP